MFKQTNRARTATIIGAAILAVMASGAAVARRSAGESAAVPQPASTAQLPQGPHRQMVRVFVHADDIYPSELRLNPGPVLLRAENRTSSDVTLVVERVLPGQANQLLAAVGAGALARRASRVLALGVGEYVYYEQSRPELRGKLVVDPF